MIRCHMSLHVRSSERQRLLGGKRNVVMCQRRRRDSGRVAEPERARGGESGALGVYQNQPVRSFCLSASIWALCLSAADQVNHSVSG